MGSSISASLRTDSARAWIWKKQKLLINIKKNQFKYIFHMKVRETKFPDSNAGKQNRKGVQWLMRPDETLNNNPSN